MQAFSLANHHDAWGIRPSLSRGFSICRGESRLDCTFFLAIVCLHSPKGHQQTLEQKPNTKPDHTTSQMYLMGFTEGQVKIQILLPGALIMALYHGQ